MKKCVAIVVTYNRKKMLKENIESLLNQTYKKHDIIIVDNASTDGTKEMILKYKDSRIKYYNTGSNIGGAGGFSFGLKLAFNLKYDYAWVMDDDSIPEKEALYSLMRKSDYLKDDFAYLASLVYWIDNKLFPMNIPEISNTNKMDLKLDLTSKYKIIPIKNASFVGCFINMKYIKKVGLPIKEFFIYGDDIEYTQRLSKENNGYLDLDSIIVHKAPSNKGADISTATKDRINRFFFQSRNGMYISRKNKKIFRRFGTIINRTFKILKNAPNCKLKRIWILYKGTICGLFFNPHIDYQKNNK